MAEHPVQAPATDPVDSAGAAGAVDCTAAITAGPGPADLTDDELDRLEQLVDADPAALNQLQRDVTAAADLVGAGYGKWPDVGNSVTTGIPCCTAAAVMGHAWCTCWTPTDDRACKGGCGWVTGAEPLDSDLCTRCQPIEQMFEGGRAEPIDLATGGFDPGSGAWPTGSTAVPPTTDRRH